MRSVVVTVCIMYALPLLSHGELYDTRNKCNCCQGPAGATGIPGINGLPGQQGKEGRTGEKGDRGDAGDAGTVGDSGSKGDKGRRGKKGECGMKGQGGNDGQTGIKGAKGQNGYKGDRGNQGEPAMPMPKVAFSAGRKKKLGPVSEDTTVTFDQIYTNVGESFDEYNSHFICKISGTYFFTVHVVAQWQVDAFAWIMMNNRHRVPLHGDKQAGYGTGANSVVLSLVPDDHVWIQLMNNSALLNDYCTFSGFLLFLN